MRRGERKEGENDAADANDRHFSARLRGYAEDVTRNHHERDARNGKTLWLSYLMAGEVEEKGASSFADFPSE